ncbi:hypothetical protein JCM10207_003321 [Rhodosporidiobolus poonsookiae]
MSSLYYLDYQRAVIDLVLLCFNVDRMGTLELQYPNNAHEAQAIVQDAELGLSVHDWADVTFEERRNAMAALRTLHRAVQNQQRDGVPPQTSCAWLMMVFNNPDVDLAEALFQMSGESQGMMPSYRTVASGERPPSYYSQNPPSFHTNFGGSSRRPSQALSHLSPTSRRPSHAWSNAQSSDEAQSPVLRRHEEELANSEGEDEAPRHSFSSSQRSPRTRSPRAVSPGSSNGGHRDGVQLSRPSTNSSDENRRRRRGGLDLDRPTGGFMQELGRRQQRYYKKRFVGAVRI